MPQCSNCPKKQAILNVGELCKACFDRQNGATDELNENDLEVMDMEDEDLDRPINIATLRDILNIVKKFTDPILQKMEKLTNPLKDKTKANESKIALLEANLKEKETKIEALTQVVVNMQSSLNAIDAAKRNTNIIISGLSEQNIECTNGETLTRDDDKVRCLFDEMGVPADTTDEFEDLEISRIGERKGNATRLVKVNLKSKSKRDGVLEKSSTLKQKHAPWNKIYVKKDLHPVYTRENQRLHKKMKDLRSKNPEKEVKIVKGVLMVDGKREDSNMFFCLSASLQDF